MVHWLEYGGIRCMPDREKKQLEELRQYLRKYPDAKAEVFWKTTGDMFARFIRLECNQSYNDLDMDVNSMFDKSLRRHTHKPSNIEYSETATKIIYEGLYLEHERQETELTDGDCLLANDYDSDLDESEDMEL